MYEKVVSKIRLAELVSKIKFTMNGYRYTPFSH